MKKILLTLLLCLGCSFKLLAQTAPVLDTSWLPQIGDYYEEYEAIYFPTNFMSDLLHHRDTGINVTWNFADMAIPGSPTNYELFLTPAYCHGNDMANLVEYEGNQLVDTTNMQRYCYLKNNTGLLSTDYISNDTEAKGSSNPSHLHEYYSRPRMEIPVPFSLHDTFADTVYQHSSDRWVGKIYYDTGWMNIAISYEGHGTLKLPGQIYDSVVMIHRKTIIWDTMREHAGNLYTFIDEYGWYHKQDRNMIVSADFTYSINPVNHDSDMFYWGMFINKKKTWTNILAPQQDNPHSFQASYSDNHLQFSHLSSGSNYHWQITDMAGRELETGKIRKQSSAETPINLPASGLFLLHITDDKTHTSSTLKIFKP